MAAGTPTKIVMRAVTARKTVNQQLTANADYSDWIQCFGDIAIQITGSATALTAVVERSTITPINGQNPAPLSTDTITGNPSTGIPVAMFYEPGVAWWRVRITALTGADITVGISTSGD